MELVQAQAVSNNHQPDIYGVSVPEHQPPASEKVHASPEPLAAGLKPHLFYKCLLNQHAQKLRKSPPIYHTPNEGCGHIPKFKSTVTFDGVSYTSSNTFQQRKMAEMDVSRVAYIFIIQKFKTDALQFIREDKTFCKSILMEYAAKMNLGKPEYETSQLGTLVPVFRSCLVFNGVAYQGDGKSKKEAEQLAARAVILKYLDSESGQDMAEIINCKFRQLVEINKNQETCNGQNVSNTALIEPNAELGPITIEAIMPAVPVVTQPPITALIEPKAELGPITIEVIMPAVPVVTQPPITALIEPKAELGPIAIEAIMSAVPVVTQPPIPVPVVTQPPIPEVSIAPIPILNQSPFPEVVIKENTPAVPAPVVLIQTASAKMKNSSTPTVVSAPCLGTLSSIIPATPIASGVIQPISLTGQSQTSGRKRNRKNKKNAQKKMCLDAQKAIPVLPATQVQPFRSQ